jgi:quercetin 2,3-dioxygenase
VILTTAGEASGETSGGARVLLVAGRPLREPIVQQGPFVMNTMQEIQQAMRDYSAGRLA